MNLHTSVRRLGWPGLAGLGLLAVAAWAHWQALPQQRQEAEAWGSEARRLRHQLLAADGPGEAHSDAWHSADEAWQHLLVSLPDASQRQPRQRQVLVAASQRNLKVATVQLRGEAQRWVPACGPGLWRQRMSLPIEGRYADVRAWLAQVLQDPAAAVDTLSVERSDPQTDQVRAQVNLSLWWRLPARVSQPAAGGCP